MVAELAGRMGKPLCYSLRSNSDTSHHPLQSHFFRAISDIHQAHSYLPGICMLSLLNFRNAFLPTRVQRAFSPPLGLVYMFSSQKRYFLTTVFKMGHTSISAFLNASSALFFSIQSLTFWIYLKPTTISNRISRRKYTVVCFVDRCVPSVSGQDRHIAGMGRREGKRKMQTIPWRTLGHGLHACLTDIMYVQQWFLT